MDLLQLEHFLAVAEEGSFTRAAERVCRTQPAISLSIKKLEDEIGAPLFTRGTMELSLTSAGKTLLLSARRIVQLRDDTLRNLRKLQHLSSGSLSIAAHESAAAYLLPGPLREYFQRFPDIKVGIQRSRLEDIPRQVMDGEVDIGFVKDAPPFHELRSVEVHSDELMLIASPRHPLAGREELTIHDLVGEPFILHHQCSTTEQKILRMFEAHNLRCNISAELWSFENVKDFVRQDVGLAIVPGICVEQELPAGTLTRIPFRELDVPRKTLMIFRDQSYRSESSRRFVEVMQEAVLSRRNRASEPRETRSGRPVTARSGRTHLRLSARR
jgi:DNA-binding transcriptional LysR family regulator